MEICFLGGVRVNKGRKKKRLGGNWVPNIRWQPQIPKVRPDTACSFLIVVTLRRYETSE